MGRITSPKTKPLAIVDSNIIVYALNTDYADKECHKKCLSLLESGLKGQLEFVLALNPIVVVEVFSVLKKILGKSEAGSRISGLLQSKRLGYVTLSREACRTSVQWAKHHSIPVNDALIAACAAEFAPTIYTIDTEHFKRLESQGLTIINPTAINL